MISKDQGCNVEQSVGSKHNSLLGDGSELVDVGLGDDLIWALSHASVNILSNDIRLISELWVVDRLIVTLLKFKFRKERLSDWILSSPRALVKWSLWICVKTINDLVPNSMQLIGTVVVFEREVIASLVTCWVLLGIPVTRVKRLVNVPIVMHQESQS